MAEQITHKRPLKIRLDKDKRKLLQEYYHLNEAQAQSQNKHNLPSQDQSSEIESTNDNENDTTATTTPTPAPVDKPISDSTLAELVHIHNTLLTKETETNNTIKNTIYENYYDLIKVNKLLSSVAEESTVNIEQLRATLELLTPPQSRKDKEST
ncbi:LAFE_0H13036g1_1 [Lachancea fermentati]|uniref:LAFE_0H13036g1_1 n=1 Tax=Lachancea fermentati TaxID=4955 RepID=A0A1G4MKW0_LACFM|nr:LAFE_0H13036g1_1 [Lachancea fermentati]